MRERNYDEFGEFIPEEYDSKRVTRCEGQYPHGCQAITMERPEHLTAVLVRVLEYVVDAWPEPASSGGALITVSGPAYAYISKLRYWDLVAKADRPEGADPKLKGWWKITNTGIAFLEGRLKVYPVAWVFRNKVLRYEGEPQDVAWFRRRHREVSRETVIEEWQPNEPGDDDPDDPGEGSA